MQAIDFDLEKARLREAERRLTLLGDLADAEYDYDRARDRAFAVGVPFKIWKGWLDAYQADGLEGLMPDWEELDEKTKAIVLECRQQLGDEVDDVTIPWETIAAIVAERNDWSYRKAKRWVRRYRIGGLWGLAPQNNPEKPRRPKGHKRALGTLDNTTLDKVYERRYILGDLADKSVVTTEEVRERLEELHAEGIPISERTFWNYLKNYREGGLSGLADRQRSDKGHHHGISDRMERIVIGLRLLKPRRRVRHVYADACKRARLLNEPEPSPWQVRDIIKKISESLLALADGRESEFRNKYRITYRMVFENIVLLIDHTIVPVLVKDTREPRYRTASGAICPHITAAMIAEPRLIMDAQFGFDKADRFRVATTIRNSLVVTDTKPYGGKPDEIWVDGGRELISPYVQELASELGTKLRYPGDGGEEPFYHHHPEPRGRLERFFEALEDGLWCDMDGYVGPNVVERIPNVQPKLTLAELVNEFQKYVDKYNNSVHSSTGETPVNYWLENCFAEPVDAERLTILLKESDSRYVDKKGIQLQNRIYWHADLDELIGEWVTVRFGPSYVPPDDLDVFYNEKWVCTAFAVDSKRGRAVKRGEIAAAQRRQRQKLRENIKDAKKALEDADREVEQKAKSDEAQSAQEKPPSVPDNSPLPKSHTEQDDRDADFLDRLVKLTQGSQEEE